MVVVGVRKESPADFLQHLMEMCRRDKTNDKTMYDERKKITMLEKMGTVLLLQNFWFEKAFLEMDLAFLRNVNGQLISMGGPIDVTSRAYKATRESVNKIRTTSCVSRPIDRPSPPSMRCK